MADVAYREAEYVAAIALMAAELLACAYCGARATTPDHVPALAEHRHVRAGVCCRLVPCCARCQSSRGAIVGNRRRRARSARRLQPGSGSIGR